jgi:hypothetical protein
MVAKIRATALILDSTPSPAVRVTTLAFESAAFPLVRATALQLEVTTAAQAPQADAGASRAVAPGEITTLDSSASLLFNTELSRAWTLVSKNPTTAPTPTALDPLTGVTLRLRMPVTATTTIYTYRITVNDNVPSSGTADVALGLRGADFAVATSSGWAPAGVLVATPGGWA